MLTSEVKRKIDAARDILVGKIPDPKAQVEQITTALIYKFMDDMDKESVEIGGKARFFTDKFEQYSWTKLMDPRLGGIERLNLYVEAISQLNQNPNIPQLFRDIFKDAFLPYRSPETLNLFLKEINGFQYEHSEDLGDAYEYLLSVLGSQGDAGQFRTPRHIINFIVAAVDPDKTDKVLDPACGTAGFLISAYKNILRKHDGLDDVYGFPTDKETPLTPDEKKTLINNFVGYDISPDMVRISRVNMYLHGFPSPTIHEYDTLSSEDRWDEMYDVILANPPFMTPKGGIRPHRRFPIQANRSEVLFVSYILEHLRPNGRAGIIVPEGIIFQSGNAYKNLRKMLIEDGLLAVVSLPSGVFNPYSGVKTSILVFDESLSRKTEDILFFKIRNDGFDLGAQRRAIDSNDLPQALEITKRYKKCLSEDSKFELINQDEDVAFLVSKRVILTSTNYDLAGERYKQVIAPINQRWSTIELGNIVDFTGGFAFKSDELVDKAIQDYLPVVKIGSLTKAGRLDLENAQYAKYENRLQSFLIRPSDILMAMTGATVGKVAIADNGNLLLNQRVGLVRAKKGEALQEYLGYLLMDERFYDYCQLSAGGGAQGNISPAQIRSFKIPLPPLEVQKEVVAELEGYQKIIDAAKQIIDTWAPHLETSDEWRKLTIQELVDKGVIEKPLDGNHGNIHPKASDYVKEGIPFVMANDLKDGVVDIKNTKKITVEQAKTLKKGFAKSDDLLITHKGTIGRTAVLQTNYDYVVLTPQITYYRVRDKNVLYNKFLKYYFDSQAFQARFKQLASIGATRAYIGITEQLNLRIALPSLNIQKQIVSRIEEEERLIEANKRLVEIYEQKTRDKIAAIWVEPAVGVDERSTSDLQGELFAA